MKRPGCAALTAALFGSPLGSTSGCTSGGGPGAGIATVSPAAAYSDAPFSLTIDGFGFRSAYDVDVVAGSARKETGGFTAFLAPSPSTTIGGVRVEATGVAWKNDSEIVAQFPAGIAEGPYDVGIHDPRGHDLIAPLAFDSLGKDLTPPVLGIHEPTAGALFGAGAAVDVVFYADDGVGGVVSLSWAVSTDQVTIPGSCPVVPGNGPQICSFTFNAPTPPGSLEPMYLDVGAVDWAGNPASDRLVLEVAPRPTVISVTPRIGSTLGGEEIDIAGTDFVPPTNGDPGTQILVNEQAISTTFISSSRLSGVSPGGDPGVARLAVSTGHAETPAGPFTIVAPAVVRLVSPATGPTTGGTPVAVVGDNFRNGGTTISFGGAPLLCARFISSNRIEGLTPPGTLTVGVAATDPVVSGNVLAGGFTYLDGADAGPPPNGDGGCGGSGP